MTLTVTDLFAGFGGASSGAVLVPGVELKIAANHWDLAVEVHNLNHPEADHAHVDLHLEDPSYFPKTDILWASPECTTWSQAAGRAPDLSPILGGWSLFDEIDEDLIASEDAATRSRLLMFDVLRFAEHHRYRYMVIENVIDIAARPKYRPAWKAWKTGLTNLGYEFRVVSLNSMHAQAHGAPAPQSRDRLYVVCWLKGLPVPDIDKIMRPRAFCPRCGKVGESFQAWKPGRTVGRYRQQYVYLCATPGCGQKVEPGWLPAAAAIDWSIPGKKIGDRDKPLAEKTRRRIAAGIARYWSPLHIEAGGNQYDAADPKHVRHGDPNAYYRAWSTADVMRVLHTIESKALVVPVEGRDGKKATTLEEPLRTQTTRLESALAFMPFIAELRGGGSDARRVADALSTITAGGNHHGLVTAVGTYMGDQSIDVTAQPLRTQTTGDYNALLTPYYGASERAKPTDEPVGTLTTVDRYALVQANTHSNRAHPASEPLPTATTATGGDAALVTRHNGSKGDGAEMTTPADEYLRTLTTTAQQSIVTPGDIAAAEAQVDDCLFRMLEPHEVGRGMAFDQDYKVRGTRREQVKGYGNAVTPPAARDLIAAVIEAYHQIEVAAA